MLHEGILLHALMHMYVGKYWLSDSQVDFWNTQLSISESNEIEKDRNDGWNRNEKSKWKHLNDVKNHVFSSLSHTTCYLMWNMRQKIGWPMKWSTVTAKTGRYNTTRCDRRGKQLPALRVDPKDLELLLLRVLSCVDRRFSFSNLNRDDREPTIYMGRHRQNVIIVQCSGFPWAQPIDTKW